MAKCSEVMTREPACCEPGDSVSRVAGIMKREDVGSVPVVESHEDKKLIGIVTDRDLVVKVLADGVGRRARDGSGRDDGRIRRAAAKTTPSIKRSS